jgi:hypothetical protein
VNPDEHEISLHVACLCRAQPLRGTTKLASCGFRGLLADFTAVACVKSWGPVVIYRLRLSEFGCRLCVDIRQCRRPYPSSSCQMNCLHAKFRAYTAATISFPQLSSQASSGYHYLTPRLDFPLGEGADTRRRTTGARAVDTVPASILRFSEGVTLASRLSVSGQGKTPLCTLSHPIRRSEHASINIKRSRSSHAKFAVSS